MKNLHKQMVQLQNLVGIEKADQILQATKKYLYENAYQKMLAEAIWATVDNILDSENMSELDLSLESSAEDINKTITLCCADCAIDQFVTDYNKTVPMVENKRRLLNVVTAAVDHMHAANLIIPEICTRFEVEISPYVGKRIDGYVVELSGNPLTDSLTVDSCCNFTKVHVSGQGWIESDE